MREREGNKEGGFLLVSRTKSFNEVEPGGCSVDRVTNSSRLHFASRQAFSQTPRSVEKSGGSKKGGGLKPYKMRLYW